MEIAVDPAVEIRSAAPAPTLAHHALADPALPAVAAPASPASAAPAGEGPAVLADLIAAGLVSHEMIGDPGRLGGETGALRLLCALVAGPVWRIEPYHYAFRADPGGAPATRAAELEAALQAELGPDAVWVSATEQPEEADLDRPLLLLRAQADAVLEAVDPGTQAVIGARFAAAAARIAAGAAVEAALEAVGAGDGTIAMALDGRLAAVEARQEAILAALEGRAEAERTAAEALGRVGAALGQLLQRLDAQAEVLHTHIAREDMVAGRLAEISAIAGTPAAFQETLGLTLAEFLARIEAGGIAATDARASETRATQAG